MSRRRKPPLPGTVRFVCVDRYHNDTGSDGRDLAAKARVEADGSITAARGITERPGPGGMKWTINCRCGVNVEIAQSELGDIATTMFAASPGAIFIDVELIALQSETGRQWLRSKAAGGPP